MTDGLLLAFQSPLLKWLTIAFFVNAALATYLKRIDQYKKMGSLPADAPAAQSWGWPFFWFEVGLKIALFVMNWRLGVLAYLLGYVLGVLGVLEQVGWFLMLPFVGTYIPAFAIRREEYPSPLVQNILRRRDHGAFVIKTLHAVGAYVGMTLMLNALRQEAKTLSTVQRDAVAGPFWGLIVLQFLFYFYIFYVAAVRTRECGYRVAWLAAIMAILGRVNGFEVLVIPAVVLIAFAVSAREKPLESPLDVASMVDSSRPDQ